MSFAHVDSVDALKELRAALWKFMEAANQSLSGADADLQRMENWLEQDARMDWQTQIKRRTLALNQARESLRSKVSISRKDGTKPRAIEEQMAVAHAQARLEYAELKLQKVKQLAKAFKREVYQYRGSMHRFVNAVQIEAPAAAAHLDGLIGSLEIYAAPEETGSTAATPDTATTAGSEQASMKRPEQLEPTAPVVAPATESDARREGD